MAEKDDDSIGLSLSLSLKPPQNLPPPFPSNLMHSLPLPFHNNQHHHHKSPLSDAFRSISDRNAETRSFLRGIDVNQPAILADGDEEVAAVSSPNSTVSSISGKRSEREENEGERASTTPDDEGGEETRKKMRLTKEQAAVLEETFKEHSSLNPKQKVALAKQLNLRPRQVEVWFQNRRARTKLKQTELDCDYLKSCCENLTEENRRLQKEVNELRALKLSPQFYMNMNPPTTLTMCPQCERVAVSSSSSSAVGSSELATTGVGIARTANQKSMSVNPWPTIIPHRFKTTD
ncbi:unnamed protein product [Ilex paraguariensis]|uniref:Homeobox domain-containing protein n=1 Tax=Ilex paraguariensis TaxID=185542 RepID=A0ABC8S2X5_9AQUA